MYKEAKGGSTMNYRKWAVIFLAVTMISTGATQIAAKSQSHDDLKNFYEACIEEKIVRCQSKSEMEGSRSKNLRLDAAIAAEKARFLSLNRNMLVEEMIDRKIGQRVYKIDVFLNEKFYNSDTGRLSSK
jgi:hypothetical protein